MQQIMVRLVQPIEGKLVSGEYVIAGKLNPTLIAQRCCLVAKAAVQTHLSFHVLLPNVLLPWPRFTIQPLCRTPRSAISSSRFEILEFIGQAKQTQTH